MSFSSDVKSELSKINNLKNKQEVYAELLGYLISANVDYEGRNIKFSTENEYNINRFAKLLNNMNIANYKIQIVGKTYVIDFNNEEHFNIKNINIESLNSELNSDGARKAFIRGCFLGGGSINEPNKKYHLEVSFLNSQYAVYVVELLENVDVKTKLLEKEKSCSIYIKDGEEISKFLAMIGANTAVLKFEEIRVLRDMKNNVNRIVNCETANLNKTINTSVEQLNDIKNIRDSGKFNIMPDDLKEIAILREANPDATLVELGNMLEKPIGKSSVSHRFKRIKEFL